MPPAAGVVTEQECRELHERERNRMDGELKSVWKAITALRIEQAKLALKVGLICGTASAVLGVVGSAVLKAIWR